MPIVTLPQSAREKIIDELLRKAGIAVAVGSHQANQDSNHLFSNTRTRSGWCLREGLLHVAQVDQRNILQLIESHGPPLIYHSLFPPTKSSSTTSNPNDVDTDVVIVDPNSAVTHLKEPSNCFQSLCRIVAGQQLAGSAAQAIWIRLLATAHPNVLSPQTILELAEQGMETFLQKPAGLSQAKAKALVDLAHHFEDQRLSEDFFNNSTEEEIREALLKVKGIGPWSCDMFLLFFLERPNVFPIGDLGVRKGLAKHFGLSCAKTGLSPTKDAKRIQQLVEPYQPYLSLLTYYMWKASATNVAVFSEDDGKDNNSPQKEQGKLKRKEGNEKKASPRPRKKKQSSANAVTP